MGATDFFEVTCCPWPPGWTDAQCYKFLKIYHALVTLPDVRDKNADKFADKLIETLVEEPQVKMVKKAVDVNMAAVSIVYVQGIRINFSNLTDAIRRNGPEMYGVNGSNELEVKNTPGLNLNLAQRVVLCTTMCRYVFGTVGSPH